MFWDSISIEFYRTTNIIILLATFFSINIHRRARNRIFFALKIYLEKITGLNRIPRKWFFFIRNRIFMTSRFFYWQFMHCYKIYFYVIMLYLLNVWDFLEWKILKWYFNDNIIYIEYEVSWKKGSMMSFCQHTLSIKIRSDLKYLLTQF